MPIIGCSAHGETWMCEECSKQDNPTACLEFRQKYDVVVHMHNGLGVAEMD